MINDVFDGCFECKAIFVINHPYFDGLYNPFMLILGDGLLLVSPYTDFIVSLMRVNIGFLGFFM